jgi:hypothetical protein
VTPVLFDAAIQHYSGHQVLDFGGCASVTDSAEDGLARFKRGFSNRTAIAWLCGAILDSEQYRRLCGQRTATRDSYFPAYRSPD